LALLNGMVNRTMKRKLPQRLERATHAWLASLTVLVLFCAWRAAPQVLWSVSGPSMVLFSISFYVGWTLALIGVFLTYHVDLFSLAHVRERLETGMDRSEAPVHPTPLLSAWLSHPCYAGILIGLWSTSVMTVGHLLLAAAATGYLLFDALWAAHKSEEFSGSRRTRQFIDAPAFDVPPRHVPPHRNLVDDAPITAKPAHHA
jgi:hypothetical protein